jgi:anti-sigma B factor antagonist
MDWEVRKETEADRDRIIVKGDLDLYCGKEFARAMLALIQNGSHRILMDLSELSYLDSTGVGALIRIMQAMKQEKGEIWFTGISGMSRRVLSMVNVLGMMKEPPEQGVSA